MILKPFLGSSVAAIGTAPSPSIHALSGAPTSLPSIAMRVTLPQSWPSSASAAPRSRNKCAASVSRSIAAIASPVAELVNNPAIAPTLSVAINTATCSTLLRPTIAVLLPTPTPSRWSRAAIRFAMLSSSAQLILLSSSATAIASGRSRACAATISAR